MSLVINPLPTQSIAKFTIVKLGSLRGRHPQHAFALMRGDTKRKLAGSIYLEVLEPGVSDWVIIKGTRGAA